MTLDQSTLLQYLNELAQDIRPIETGVRWFEAQTPEERAHTLSMLEFVIEQARGTREDGLAAISRAGLEPTETAAVLVGTGQLNVQVGKMRDLPGYQQVPAFRLLVAMFAIADTRRRARCGPDCQHFWHDLRDGGSP